MWSGLRSILSRLHGLLTPGARRRARERDFDEEMRAHLDLLTEQHVRSGLSLEDARRVARVAFGNETVVREARREGRTLPAIESFWTDIRFALRLCRRSPGFTAVAILTLALGIGTNTTLFTALDAVAYRPLPVADSSRAARLERWFVSGNRGNIQYLFSYPEYLYIREHGQALGDLTAASWIVQAWEPSSDAEPIRTQFVSSNFFDALGARAAAGRLLHAGPDGRDDEEPLAIISHPFWQRRFGGSFAAVGSNLRLNGVAVTIAGIADAEFIGIGNPPQVPDIWLPRALKDRVESSAANQGRQFQLVGHLADAVAWPVASARMTALASALDAAMPAVDRTTAITVEPATFFGETNDPRFRLLAAGVMVAVSLVLLVACANVANLLLARSGTRQKEIAVRLALGASRARLVRQLLTESFMLGLFAGAAGLLLSMWGSRVLWLRTAEALQMFVGGDAPLIVRFSPDVRIFAYTFAVSLATSIAFGLSPALRSSRPDLNTVLKAESAGPGRRHRSLARGALVAGQMGISLTLLLVAGLLLRGMLSARFVDAGFDTRRLYDIEFPRGAQAERAPTIERRVIDRLQQTPGVKVALSDPHRLPLAGTWTPPIVAEQSSGRAAGRTLANRVTSTYFDTFGIPILRGRAFTDDELRTDAPVAVISEGAAGTFWPGQDPIGRSFTLDMDFRGTLKRFGVIGIVKDVRSANISRIDPSYVYLPLTPSGQDHVLVRSAIEPRALRAIVADTIAATDPSVGRNVWIISLEDGPIRLQKLIPAALAAFASVLAVIALTLAAAGIYGVVTYLAAERVPEIGVRLALGATRADVLRLVLLEGLRPVALGILAGIVCASILSALLRATLAFPSSPDLLFGVSAFDPVTFTVLTLLVAAVACAASLAPALRASRVDPIETLRHP
jgi:predicted permease